MNTKNPAVRRLISTCYVGGVIKRLRKECRGSDGDAFFSLGCTVQRYEAQNTFTRGFAFLPLKRGTFGKDRYPARTAPLSACNELKAGDPDGDGVINDDAIEEAEALTQIDIPPNIGEILFGGIGGGIPCNPLAQVCLFTPITIDLSSTLRLASRSSRRDECTWFRYPYT